MKFTVTIEFDSPDHLKTFTKHVKMKSGAEVINDKKMRVVLTKTDDIAKFFGRTIGLIGISKLIKRRR